MAKIFVEFASGTPDEVVQRIVSSMGGTFLKYQSARPIAIVEVLDGDEEEIIESFNTLSDVRAFLDVQFSTFKL